MLIDETVHISRQTSKTVIGAAQHCFRSLKALAGQQLLSEIAGVNALHHPGKALQRLLGSGIMIAGVEQIEAVDPAVAFRGIGFRGVSADRECRQS